MKKFAFLFVCLLSVGSAKATVISFENLISNGPSSFGNLGINNSYQGFNWTASNGGQWGVVDCESSVCFGDQPLTAVTGTSYGWSFSGPQSLFIDFGQATDVIDAYFAGQFANRGNFNSSSIQLFGYDSGSNLVASSSVLSLIDSQWQLLSANMSGIFSLEIRSDRDNSWFAIDDLRINQSTAVPEPTSLALLGLALFGMGLSRKKFAK